MDDIDRTIKEVVAEFFHEGHIKISSRTIAARAKTSVRVVSTHISRHDLGLCWEKRDRGIIVLAHKR